MPDMSVPADPNIAFHRPKSEMSKVSFLVYLHGGSIRVYFNRLEYVIREQGMDRTLLSVVINNQISTQEDLVQMFQTRMNMRKIDV